MRILFRLIGVGVNHTLGRLSTIHPLVILLVYFVVVPAFAAIYVFLPASFYAPYAHQEPTAFHDDVRASEILQASIKRQLRGNETLKAHSLLRIEHVTAQKPKVVSDGQVSIRLDCVITRSDGVMGIFQIEVIGEQPGPLLIFASKTTAASVSMQLSQPEYGIWPLQWKETSAGDSHDLYKDIFETLFVRKTEIGVLAGAKLTLTEQGDVISYFDGIHGDPTATSDAYLRMLYFSIIVITTIGFGDIVPMTPHARVLVGAEAVLGLLLLGLFFNSLARRASVAKAVDREACAEASKMWFFDKTRAKAIEDLPKERQLLIEMVEREAWAFKKGHRTENWITFCWWGALICAGVASFGGALAAIPSIGPFIQPWMISLFALLASGFEIVRQRAAWRAKSNEYYRHRDDMRRLITQAKYQTADWNGSALAEMAQDFTAKRDLFGVNMQKINSLRDDASAAAKPE